MVSWVGSAPRICARRGEVVDDLRGRVARHAGFGDQPRDRPRPARATAGAARGRARRSLTMRRQLGGSAGRFAEPERNGRRRAVRVGDADHAAGHLQDPPRAVAELKDVAGVAFDREVFVQRAEERLVGVEHDPVVGDIGNGAARRQRGQARRSLGHDPPVHLVAMDQPATAPAPRREALGEHPEHGVEVRRARDSRYGQARRTIA